MKEAIIAMATRGQLQTYVEPYKDWVLIEQVALSHSISKMRVPSVLHWHRYPGGPR